MSQSADSFGAVCATSSAVACGLFAFQLFDSFIAAGIGAALGYVAGFMFAFGLAMLFLVLVGLFGQKDVGL